LCAFAFDGVMPIFSELFGVTPTILISVFISISLLEKPGAALVFAIIVGILSDFQSGKLIGAQVFLFSVLAILLNYLISNFSKINFLTIILAATIAAPTIIMFKFLIFYVFKNYGNNFFAFWHYFGPNILQTVILTPFVYYFNEFVNKLLNGGERH
jgi:rod shape-determining protein MreD